MFALWVRRMHATVRTKIETAYMPTKGHDGSALRLMPIAGKNLDIECCARTITSTQATGSGIMSR
jgi:hypothetical protein